MSERPRKSFPSRLASSFIRVWTSPAHPAPTPPYVTYICGSSVGALPWETRLRPRQMLTLKEGLGSILWLIPSWTENENIKSPSLLSVLINF